MRSCSTLGSVQNSWFVILRKTLKRHGLPRASMRTKKSAQCELGADQELGLEVIVTLAAQMLAILHQPRRLWLVGPIRWRGNARLLWPADFLVTYKSGFQPIASRILGCSASARTRSPGLAMDLFELPGGDRTGVQTRSRGAS